MGKSVRRHRAAGATLAMSLALAAAGGVPAFAVDGAAEGRGPGALPGDGRDATAVRPFRVREAAAVASGGTALRNLRGGGIRIAGLAGRAAEAWLYWAVITDGLPPDEVATIMLRREQPTRSVQRTLTGTEVGQGVTSCWWGGTLITVYRARVPTTVAIGNGSHLVTLPAGVPGATDGSDPRAGSPMPAYEGASLVVIQDAGADTVALYDADFAGRTFTGNGGPAVDLALPGAIAGSDHRMRMHLIGADGQDGGGGLAIRADMSGETTSVNGIPVGGPGSARNDSDWNGSAGQPQTKLWDNRAADVTHGKVPGGRRLALAFGQPGGTDCLTPVAVAVQG